MDTNNNSKDLGDLESLVKMYKEGFLTDEEFKRAKAKILGDSDTKEKTENVTDELEGTEPESSDNSQENAATESSKAEKPLEPDPSKKTSSEKNINTEISDKETNKTASSNSEVKKKKNYKKLYWGIGIVAVVALSVCAYLAYLYPTQNELLCFFNQGNECYAAGLDYQEGTDTIIEDDNIALKYYEYCCDVDNAISCGNLVFYYS
uniref:SHOCT domain-containing protein n=1 Tax=Succinivibrio sp. TaxID=2053619 RepID=UPI00402AA398